MDHQICLNTNSFPALSAEQAYILFNDALQGMLQLNDGGDRFTLYLDSEELLNEFKLAENYTYVDFTTQLHDASEIDLYLFLLELVDKSPALDFIDDEVINEMAEYSFYMPRFPSSDNGEVFSLAYFLSATLLSIKSSKQWSSKQLNIARISDDGRYIDETLSLNNIACEDHGRSHFEGFKYVDINAICDNCLVSEYFVDWYEDLTTDNKHKVVDKYRLAVEREFNGGEPLFKTLADGNGMREIRFSAYSGGAIRILFKSCLENKQAILLGFIKKSNNEGYAENIPKAHSIYDELVQ